MSLAAARARVDQLVELGLAGVAVVRVPPGTQARYAHALAEAPGVAVVALEQLDPARPSRVVLVAGLPRPRPAAVAALARFNSMRDLLHARGALVVLVLDRWELADLQLHAGDAWSTQLFVEAVPFEPVAGTSPEDARRVLTSSQRDRLGRLDLRGFIRAENEDVSWRVEDIYQDLKATAARFGTAEADDRSLPSLAFGRPIMEWFALPEERLIVVLGHPGSGKSFFLRWLALTMGTRDTFAGVERPIPVLLSLAAYAATPGPLTLFEYAVETLLLDAQPTAHVLASEAEAGRVVFLLDGIDEVGDGARRARVATAILALREQHPRCRVVATSRLAGFDAEALPGALHLTLAAFDDATIQSFLHRWCEMYAVDRAGDTPASRHQGREEGEALARDVLAHPEVRALAGSPLLLTVIAIVHRTGVRLPDHRVELYEHATRILVERWNRARSAASTSPAPPLKAADAARLLGPVALEMIRTGTQGVIREDRLRHLLDQSLKSGGLRGLATADEAIVLFRNTLGLLVEQGPEVYAFMHLTLAEYFAAWELVRTDALEELAAQEGRAFRAEWREVILLALGVLGVLRGDDARLERVVRRLMQSATRRKGKPSPIVPSLFGGLLADDPGLSDALLDAVVKFLVPTWWFEKKYGIGSIAAVADAAEALVLRRIPPGRVFDALQREVQRAYANGPTERARESLVRSQDAIAWFLLFLRILDVDNGPSLWSFLGPPTAWATGSYWSFDVVVSAREAVCTILFSRWLYSEIRRGAIEAKVVRLRQWHAHGSRVFACDGDLRNSRDMGAFSKCYTQVESHLRPAAPEEFAAANEADSDWELVIEYSPAPLPEALEPPRM